MKLTPYRAQLGTRETVRTNYGRMPRIALQMREEDVLSALLTGAFAGCSEREVLAFMHAGRQFVLPSQWAFIQEQTPAHDLYVLLNGSAMVSRGRRVLARVLPGEMVGELGMRSPGVRTATVTSSDRVRLLRVEYPTVGELLRRRPNLAARIDEIAARRAAREQHPAFA
jgi:CRP/FNR family cyclic AMP-dependent transcriptional regulator